MVTESQWQLIEKTYAEAEYGYQTTRAIIEHPEHGRLLITDAFGGMDGTSGGMVRWRHGYAIKLKPEDTFEDLSGEWNEHITHLEAVLKGHDEERPILGWSGHVIESIAQALGLP